MVQSEYPKCMRYNMVPEKVGLIDETTDAFNVEKECSIIKENEVIGLLVPTDYKNASLDSGCIYLDNYECGNRNYLSNDEEFNSWLLNSTSKDTYNVLSLYNSEIQLSRASNLNRLNYVVNISSKSIVAYGKGTHSNPYIIK